jgi:hypothetical protein
MNRDVLFYSGKCPYSNKLLNLVQSCNLVNHFNLVCIENIPKNSIPSMVTKVPTIVAYGKKPFVGADAFRFVNAKRLIGQQTNRSDYINNVDTNATLDTNPLLMSAKNKNIQINDKGPKGLAFTEIEKISDNYAFVEDEDDDKEAQKRLQYLNKSSESIFNLPMERKKIKRQEQDERLKMIMNQRNQELNYHR